MAKKDAVPDVLPFVLTTSVRPDNENLALLRIERLAELQGDTPADALANLRGCEGMLLLSRGGSWYVAIERARLRGIGIEFKG